MQHIARLQAHARGAASSYCSLTPRRGDAQGAEAAGLNNGSGHARHALGPDYVLDPGCMQGDKG